jgi:enoyl-CoA hydratase/carnithine racemase
MSDELLYEATDDVGTITLNRLNHINTIAPKMLASLSTRLLETDSHAYEREPRAPRPAEFHGE